MEIKKGTFKKGIHPSYNKHYTSSLPIEIMPSPKEVAIPMSMHTGAPATPVVEVGQYVHLGELIGQAAGYISANIHASVSGTVKAIEPRLMGNGSKVTCVVIENDFQDAPCENVEKHDPETVSPEEIIKIIQNAGIVGEGGATFPTSVKLSPGPDAKIDYVIINGAECEPYLTSDHAFMREHADKVAGGLHLAMKVFGLEKGYIGIEDNKPDAIEAFRALNDDSIIVYELETKYPQGSEKHLISAIAGREVPSGGLPAQAGCIVINAGTAGAIYDAVTEGKPLYERVVTVTGSGIKQPRVLSFRIGTNVNEIIEYCGGLTDDIAKVILGGPMMGPAIYDPNVPAGKGTSGILCLNRADAHIEDPSNCIRCAKCTEVCPMGLMPMYLGAFSQKRNFEKCDEYNALDCIECGCCAFTCPARRPLVAEIRVAKRGVQALRKKRG